VSLRVVHRDGGVERWCEALQRESERLPADEIQNFREGQRLSAAQLLKLSLQSGAEHRGWRAQRPFGLRGAPAIERRDLVFEGPGERLGVGARRAGFERLRSRKQLLLEQGIDPPARRQSGPCFTKLVERRGRLRVLARGELQTELVLQPRERVGGR